ncbi:MAG TPA: hypothetical protein PLA01_02095 [Acetivibrio sp.]|nr:hypothetical protein [Acetivibrio sp.]
MKEKRENASAITIKHHLANKDVRESMKGYKVPINDRTIAAYRILSRYGKFKE